MTEMTTKCGVEECKKFSDVCRCLFDIAYAETMRDDIAKFIRRRNLIDLETTDAAWLEYAQAYPETKREIAIWKVFHEVLLHEIRNPHYLEEISRQQHY